MKSSVLALALAADVPHPAGCDKDDYISWRVVGWIGGRDNNFREDDGNRYPISCGNKNNLKWIPDGCYCDFEPGVGCIWKERLWKFPKGQCPDKVAKAQKCLVAGGP